MLTHIILLLVTPAALSVLLVDRVHPIALAVAGTFATFYSTILTLIVAYRISPVHPLAAYPGPIMCKLSKFWMAYIARKGKQHLYIQGLHERYGDIVRIGERIPCIFLYLHLTFFLEALTKYPYGMFPPSIQLWAVRDFQKAKVCNLTFFCSVKYGIE